MLTKKEINKRYYNKHRNKILSKNKLYKQNNVDIVKKHTQYSVVKERYSKRKQELILYLGNKCADCLQQFPECVYDFHHLDITKKEKSPAILLKGNIEKAFSELKECILLCSNCHRIRHWN
jgi:hypothetical protein